MKCLICHNHDLYEVYSNRKQFLYTQGVIKSPDDSRIHCIKELDVNFCNLCGYIFNPNPRTSENDETYKELYALNPQDLSVKDVKHLEYLFSLILTYTKLDRNYNILEIGSNDGYLLNMFYENQFRCVGIDPSPSVNISKRKYPKIKVIQDYYDPSYFEEKFDLIICRNVIEHLDNPIKFIKSIKKCVKLDGFVYFEVPNAEKFINEKIFTNFYHEHISYFIKDLFEEINNSLGFKTTFIDVINKDDVISYIGQNVSSFSEFKLLKYPDLETITTKVKDFTNSFKSFKTELKKLFSEFIEKKYKIGIWGAGCTAINIFSYLEISDYDEFYIYDSSDTKQGKYLPGLNKKIKSPNNIVKNDPDVVLIMSERYINEIYQSLKKINYSKEIWKIYPKIERILI